MGLTDGQVTYANTAITVSLVDTCGNLWMVLGTSPKVTMDGRLYNQLCLLSSATKLVGGLLTGPYAEDC